MHRRPFAVLASLALAVPATILAAPVASAAPVTIPAASYDFNGDGFADLAVGTPSYDVGSVSDAGAVVVVPGSASGPVVGTTQTLTQATTDVAGDPQERGYWGSTLASGDFNRDGYADLAVGNGSVTVLLGSAAGLTGTGSYVLAQGPAAGELVSADLDKDGRPELVVGEPDAGPSASSPTGAVRIYSGSTPRYAFTSSVELYGQRQATNGDIGFGSTLAAGDLDGDGSVDLAVGSEGPGYPDDEGFSGPGSVSVCYNGPAGFASCTRLAHDRKYAGNQSAAIGNVSGSDRNEIVVGVPAFPPAKSQRGGAVEILSLSGSGTATTAKVRDLNQASAGVRGSAESNDLFGFSVALGHLDRDAYDDLVIGAPGEDNGSGRVTVVYGAKKGYRTSGGLIYDQDTKGIPGKAERRDGFGAAVSLLDHDADGLLDLAVGAPGEDVSSEDGDKGAVTTLRGAGKSFTTAGAQTFTLKTLGVTQVGDEDFGEVLGR